jgi:hypothetical protein
MPYLPALHPELTGFHARSNHKLSARKNGCVPARFDDAVIIVAMR